MLVQVQSQHPDIKVWSDASGSWDCAAVWFQISWKDHPEFMNTSIVGKEMLPIAVAAAIWGKEWRGCTVEFNCDNEAVVHSLTAGSCKEKNMAHMLRCLFLQFLAICGSSPGLFFTFKEGTLLFREFFVARVRSALTVAGIQASQFAGHSFRIGAASTAAAKGVKDSLIKTLG